MNETDNVEATEVAEAPVEQRPEWLPEKFNSPEDMATSYSELESKLGQDREAIKTEVQKEFEEQRLNERPASVGDYAIPESLDETAVNDDALFRWWAQHSYEQGFGQEKFDAGIEQFVKYYDSQQPDLDAEEAKLGENAKARIEACDLWAQKFFPEHMAEAVLQLGTSAAGIEAIEHMMSNSQQTTMGSAGQANPALDEDAVRAKMKDPRYWNPAKRDAAYVKEVDEAFSKLYP